MSKVAFKQCDVERLLRAAKAVGYEHPTVDALPDGGLRLLTKPEKATERPLSALEKWERSNGRSDA